MGNVIDLQWTTGDTVCIDPEAMEIDLDPNDPSHSNPNFYNVSGTLECLDDQDSGSGDLDQDWVFFCDTLVFLDCADVLIVTLAVSKTYLMFVNFYVFFD